MAPLLDTFDAASHSASQQTRLLYRWLSSEQQRPALYQELAHAQRILHFTSRADTKFRATDPGDSTFHQQVYLLTNPAHIQRALTDSAAFSNRPYLALGSGTFMLGLDKDQPSPRQDEHLAQRTLAMTVFKYSPGPIAVLSQAAFKVASVLPLKTRQFDLVYLAEQAALRFVGFLFGFAQSDIGLLEQSMRKAYRGLNYQILGRHFATSPGTLPEAVAAMGALLVRSAQLIDQYQAPITEKECDDRQALDKELQELQAFHPALTGFEPVLQRLAKCASPYSGTELAAFVVGAITGIIGNVQASISIAIGQFFALRRMDAAKAAALQLTTHPADTTLAAMVTDVLRQQPPVPFLARELRTAVTFGDTTIPAGAIAILAMGAATPGDASLIFGGTPGDHLHQCLGQHIATPLVCAVVQQVLLLPGLAQTLDEVTGAVRPLEKDGGFSCVRYPLQFTVDKRTIQQPLNVVMPIKKPVAEHAEALKKVIAYGAPRIELRLEQSRHVHFAWFEFMDNDNLLALHTVFDGDFDAYIEHFALQIGPLFDLLLEHIEGAPPLPVAKFPKEFIDTIRRYNRPPAGRYFYSAYPMQTVDKIKGAA